MKDDKTTAMLETTMKITEVGMHRVYTIMIPPEVNTTPPPKATGWRHPEPVNPRAFGEAMARKKRGAK